MSDYAAILSRRYQNKQWTLNGNDYEGLVWLDESPKPSKTKLDSLANEVIQEIADEAAAKIATRQAVLDKLGLTADEVAALFG